MGAIYLVRHGQAPAYAYGIGAAPEHDEGLTDLGRQQARATGELLAAQVGTFDAAVSGGLARQRATMRGVLSAFGAPPEPAVDPGWDEYEVPFELISADPHAFADGAAYQRRLDAALQRWIAPAVGDPVIRAETFAQYSERTRAAGQRAAALAGKGRNVLVVSSAGTITALIAQLWDVPQSSWPKLARTVVNASVSKLLVGRSGITVVSLNEHAHLAARPEPISTFR